MDAREQSLSRLEKVTTTLSQLHRELAQVLIAERQAKVESFLGTQDLHAQARDRQADAYAVSLSVEVFKLRGEISALTEERDYLIFYLSFLKEG